MGVGGWGLADADADADADVDADADADADADVIFLGSAQKLTGFSQTFHQLLLHLLWILIASITHSGDQT